MQPTYPDAQGNINPNLYTHPPARQGFAATQQPQQSEVPQQSVGTNPPIQPVGMGGGFAKTQTTAEEKPAQKISYDDGYKAAGAVQSGMASGSYAGIGAGLGTAVGAVTGGPVGTVIGSAVGGAAGGMLDMWLASVDKEEKSRQAEAARREKEQWQKYQMRLEQRGRAMEDEKLQYARDEAQYGRYLNAQTEALKTKNYLMQAGTLYNMRKGRNWYGQSGVQAQVRGSEIPQGTTAQDLGFTGKTAEQIKVGNPTVGLGV